MNSLKSDRQSLFGIRCSFDNLYQLAFAQRYGNSFEFYLVSQNLSLVGCQVRTCSGYGQNPGLLCHETGCLDSETADIQCFNFLGWNDGERDLKMAGGALNAWFVGLQWDCTDTFQRERR